MEEALRLIKKIIPKSLFSALSPWYHFLLAFSAAAWFRFPSKKLVVIGVTGTKGKTTVVELVHEVLASSGAKVASASSLRFRIGEESEDNRTKMTTPGRFFVQKFLRRAANAGCKYAVLEVTSEAIKQFRHHFVAFDAAVVTQIAPEHVESHGSFERYLRAKLDLFWRVPREGYAVINRDDPYAARFASSTAAHKVWYGSKEVATEKLSQQVTNIRISPEKIQFELAGHEFISLLRGKFNFYNVCAAVAVGVGEHIPLDKIKNAIARVVHIPGRMEIVQEKPFMVVIDYAHTPDSLREVYSFLTSYRGPMGAGNALICLFGAAGGGRDKWKRPEFGKVASEFCGKIFLTNEDPYEEDPAQIISEIEKGVSREKQASVVKIVDRRTAIAGALASAKPGDTVILTGKGAESWIVGAGGEKIQWNEKEAVLEELAKTKDKRV